MAKQEYRGYTQAQHEANQRYIAKTYKTYSFRLRLGDDADIIQALEETKEQGYNKREWLRELYEGKPSSGYTRQQIVETFADFRGVLTKEIIERMLDNVE